MLVGEELKMGEARAEDWMSFSEGGDRREG